MIIRTERLKLVDREKFPAYYLWEFIIYLGSNTIGKSEINRKGYVRYEIKEKYRNNGYATEALKGVVVEMDNIGLKPLLRIWFDNEASKKVATKSGFKLIDDPNFYGFTTWKLHAPR